MNQTKTVQSIEEAGQTTKGAPYWKVTWNDGKTDNIFKAEHFDILEQADREGRQVDVSKIQQGKYWNVSDVKLANEPKEENGDHFLAHEAPLEELPMTKTDWAEKDKKTRISIQRQTALREATIWATAQLQAGKEGLSGRTIMQLATEYTHWMETLEIKEVQKVDSKLVKEIKKLGAEEVERKEDKN